jgi:hypothetical protein
MVQGHFGQSHPEDGCVLSRCGTIPLSKNQWTNLFMQLIEIKLQTERTVSQGKRSVRHNRMDFFQMCHRSLDSCLLIVFFVSKHLKAPLKKGEKEKKIA